MAIFMLIGAVIFSIFIYVCMFSMVDFQFSWRDEFKIALALLVWFFIGKGIEYLLGTEGYILPIVVFGLIIHFSFMLKNLKKSIAFILYMAALSIGMTSAMMLLAEVSRQELSPMHIIVIFGFILGIGQFLIKFLKKRIDVSIFNHAIFHLLVVIASFALVFIYLIHIIEDVTNLVHLGNILFLLTTGIMMVVISYYFTRERKMQNQLTLAEASKKYIQELEESYQALRTIRHDYVNILATLKLGIDQGNIEELSDYYYSELAELNKDLLQQDQLIGSLYHLHLNEIKSILIYKCSAAASAGITTTFEIKESVEKLGASTAIICQILGILLDNAIEAATETEAKKIEIAIIKNPNSTIFIIKNTWKKQRVALNQLSELGFSTKGTGRGIGLHTVRTYTDKMEGLYLESQMDDEYFTQILSVKE